MDANHAVLTQIAAGKLMGTRPKAWDTDARSLFESEARKAYASVDPDELEAAWRDALAMMRSDYRTDWDEYSRQKRDYAAVTATPWDKVKLKGGRTDGDTFELRFDVDGSHCVIECTDVQLLDPEFMIRKLTLYTVKDVYCPFVQKRGGRITDEWRRNVVLPWLRQPTFEHTEREMTGAVVEDLIREYCERTLDGSSDPNAFVQAKRPVMDKGFLYVPFAGVQEYVSKRTTNDLGKRVLKNTLKKLGFNEIKRGRNSMRFHTIKTEELYVDTQADARPGETGGGQEHAHRADGQDVPGPGTHGALDLIRQEKRTRSGNESGDGHATHEGQEDAPAVPDDPFAAL